MTAKLRLPLPPLLPPFAVSVLPEELSVVHAAARNRGTANASASSRLGPAIEVLLCSRTQPWSAVSSPQCLCAVSSPQDHAWRAARPGPDPRDAHRTGDSDDGSTLLDVEILSSDHEQVVFCRDP